MAHGSSKAPDLGDGLPAAIRWVAIGVAVGASVYSSFAYAGPYRWLAELQLRLFGGYVVQLTFLVTLIMFALATLIAVGLAQRFGFVRSATPAELKDSQAQSERLNRQAELAKWPLYLFVIGGVTAFVGGRDLWIAEEGRTLQKLTAAQLERGALTTSTWLQLSGVTLDRATVTAKVHSAEYFYIPLVSETWTREMPVTALLKVKTDATPRAAPHEGTIDPEGLPGMVRVAFEENGLAAGGALVLRIGQRPDEEETKAQWLFGGGMLLCIVGAAMLSLQLRGT